ncbi:MAG TPA: amidohydrolase family protein, partial [Acidimicrobiia bacterium]|nr:amidohydrolase family protein [Acidimicrobiia bacterium]
GVDRIMWGSDYPHHEATYPYSRESLRLTFSGWGEVQLRQMLGENAAKVYGFDLDVLAPIAAEYGPTVEEIATPLDAIPADATSPAFVRRDRE